MLREFLRTLSFLILSLALVGCAAQKSLCPLKAADVNPSLNSGRPVPGDGRVTAEKPGAGLGAQAVEAEREAKPVKETGKTSGETTVSKSEPKPESVSIALTVQFDFGKANVEAKYRDELKRIAVFMEKYPSAPAVIIGHTDHVGKEAVNVRLSYLRAANIKSYLASNFGINRSRLKAIGYDDREPIADNKTARGRQANRRAEIRIEAHTSGKGVYSYFEDSDLPKGGFAIVNQESIDAKIKSLEGKKDAAQDLSKMVKTPTLELYKMWGGVFSHCAIRIETDRGSFYQIELQSLPDLQKAGMKDYHRIGAAVALFGTIKDQMDVVEFSDKDERQKLDHQEPPYATMPICVEKQSAVKSTRWYRDCLSGYAGSYNPGHSLKAGKRTKVFEYNPVTRNCCNFAEEALKACGLAHCFDLGKSTGLDHKPGPLEE